MSNPLAEAIITSLKQNPHEWKANSIYLTHQPSEIRLWIGGGTAFMQVEGQGEHTFGFITNRRIWKAFQQMIAQQLIQKDEQEN